MPLVPLQFCSRPPARPVTRRFFGHSFRNSFRHRSRLALRSCLATLGATLLGLAPAHAAPELHQPPGPLAVNESVEVLLSLDAGEEFVGEPRIPTPTGLALTQPEEFARFQTTRQRVYRLKALQPGRWTLGPVSVQTKTGSHRLQPLPVRVREEPIGELIPIAGSHAFLSLATDLDQVYVGQRSHFHATIFLPEGARLIDTRSPLDLARSRVVAAPPTDLSHGLRRQINGEDYDTWSFAGHFTAVGQGQASLGPGTLGVLLEETVHAGPSFASTRVTRPRRETLISGRLPIKVLPLPAGAPADFRGAVGRYQLRCIGVSPQLPRAGDPLYLEFTASGDGDLPRLPAPVPVDAEDWQIELLPDANSSRSAIETRGERQFTFVLRPQPGRFPLTLPRFRLTWFDPLEVRYASAEVTPPAVPLAGLRAADETIPGSLGDPGSPGGHPEFHPEPTPTPEPAPADIVSAPLDPREGLLPGTTLPWRRSTATVHAGGAGLLAALALTGLILRRRRRAQEDPRRQWLAPLAQARTRAQAAQALTHALGPLEIHSPDPAALAELRAALADLEAAAFQRGGNPDAALDRLLHQRLLATARRALPPASRAPKPGSATPSAPRTNRRHTPNSLWLWALLLLTLTSLTPAPLHAQDPPPTPPATDSPPSAGSVIAPNSPSTPEIPPPFTNPSNPTTTDPARARQHWQNWGQQHGYSANLCVLLGDASFRLQDSAQATLWYRRALLLNPFQPEARHNLTIAHPRSEAAASQQLGLRYRFRAALNWFAPAFWWIAAACVAAPFALCLRAARPWWMAATTSLALALVAALARASWADLPEPESQLTVLRDTPVQSVPAHSGPALFTLSRGDACQLLAARGPWNFVEIPRREDLPLRGWIPATTTEALWPPRAETQIFNTQDARSEVASF